MKALITRPKVLMKVRKEYIPKAIGGNNTKSAEIFVKGFEQGTVDGGVSGIYIRYVIIKSRMWYFHINLNLVQIFIVIFYFNDQHYSTVAYR